MATITIKNVGPIKDVTIPLNKVNVFMGEQSSGKSTIAKIVSACSWLEKERMTSLGDTTFGPIEFLNRLEVFHNMKGYFGKDSVVEYKNNEFSLRYTVSGLGISGVECVDDYIREKISYIPSERFVISLPEIMKVDFPNNNIRNFIFDWFTARKYYQENTVDILNLDVRYKYDEKTNQDSLILNNGQSLLLANASSGLQTVTPLVVLINYLTEWIYKNNEDLSFEKQQRNEKVTNYISRKMGINEKSIAQIDNLTRNHFTKLILEEPEQNLFPSTQRDLLYFLMQAIQKDGRDHSLTLTTHSPYILYALNNCMMAYLVKDTMPKDVSKTLPCYSSMINPKDVSVWEIEDGGIRSIQDDDGIVAGNYFDQKLTELTDEYYTMINYWDEDE